MGRDNNFVDHINLSESDKKFKLNDKTIIREMETKRRERKRNGKWNDSEADRRCKKAVTVTSLERGRTFGAIILLRFFHASLSTPSILLFTVSIIFFSFPAAR